MSRSSISSSDARQSVRFSVRPAPIFVLMVALTLAGAESAVRLPAIQHKLPDRLAYYDPAVSIRLDALDGVLREHGRVDVLFTGSSIVRTNVQPLLFDQLMQMDSRSDVVSFNTGMLGLWPAGVHLYLERVWLPAVLPRFVIQGIRYPELRSPGYAVRDEQFFGGVIERGWHPDAGATARVVSWTTQRVRLLQYRGTLADRLRGWVGGRPGRLAAGGRSVIDSRGYQARQPPLGEARARGFLDDTAPHTDSCAEVSCAVGLAAIARSQELALGHGAVYVLVNVPEFAERWPGAEGQRRYTHYLAAVREFADARGFPFMDVTHGNPARFDDEQDFSDFFHMSPQGAERFTRELAAALAPLVETIVAQSARETAW